MTSTEKILMDGICLTKQRLVLGERKSLQSVTLGTENLRSVIPVLFGPSAHSIGSDKVLKWEASHINTPYSARTHQNAYCQLYRVWINENNEHVDSTPTETTQHTSRLPRIQIF